MKVFLREVTTRSDLKRFAAFTNEMYKGQPYYVPQILSMEVNTLDPKKNHAYEVCEGRYWLALDETGRAVGRVAAIINHSLIEKLGRGICRFGWMDFIDDTDVSKALFDQVASYAREHGLDTLVGPMGFLEFDACGIIVEGFDQLPTAYGKYNFPYYERHFLEYGFQKDVDFVEYRISIPEEAPDRYLRAADVVAGRYALKEVCTSSIRKLIRDGYVDKLFKCMNEGYSKIGGFTALTPGQCEDLKNQFVPNLTPDLVSVIADENDDVVGFGVCMPSLAKALQKADGHLFPFGFLHILHAVRHNDTIDTLLIAIRDDYSNKGVIAMIFDKIIRSIYNRGIRYIESTRELETNVNVQNLWGRYDRQITKRARVYTRSI